ncbi:MAG TPA: YCF48-related protein [Blastocatellia bacterium]|nr:YCF48-related protein [Blastocatellia bacterium]
MQVVRKKSTSGRRGKKAGLLASFTIFAFFASGSNLFEGSSLSNCVSTSAQQPEWRAQSSGSLAKLSSVIFVDRDRGWVAGANGTLLTTEDGGAKWSRQTLPERYRSEALNDVWFFNSDRGLLLGEYGLVNRIGKADRSERVFLLRSNNHGANWDAGALARLSIKQAGQSGQPGQSERQASRNQNESSDTLKPSLRLSDPILLRMAFANDQVGWTVGESGTIQYTEDGGATWMMQEASTRKLLYDVAAIDAKQAWAVGAGGKLLRTVDGGTTWNEKSSEVAEALRSVHFLDAKHGWAVGARGTIISTNNGGARWQRQTSGVELNLNDVFFVNAKEGSGEVSSEGWIAGDRGLLLRTTDGGATWESVELSTHANLSRLFFITPDCGWVVGTSGAIFKYGQIRRSEN